MNDPQTFCTSQAAEENWWVYFLKELKVGAQELKEEDGVSMVFLQSTRFACTKPSTNTPIAESNFLAVMCFSSEITGNLLSSAFEQTCHAPCSGGRKEGRAPHPSWLKHAPVPNHWQSYPLETAGNAALGSAFAWGGFCGGHVCVQSCTYSSTGQPSRCSYKCKLTAKGRNRRRRHGAPASQRGKRLIFYWRPLLRGELKIHLMPSGKCLFWLQRMVPDHGKIKTSK